ncbi:hypothetical protein AAG906_035573 [Vitis piasezkii]
MTTPSQSQSSGRGRKMILNGVKPSKRGKKKTLCYAFRPQHQGLLVVSVQEARWQTRGQSQNQYTLGQQGLFQEHTTRGLMSHIHPCLELPVRKAQIPLIFQQKDNVLKNHSCQVQCAQD